MNQSPRIIQVQVTRKSKPLWTRTYSSFSNAAKRVTELITQDIPDLQPKDVVEIASLLTGEQMATYTIHADGSFTCKKNPAYFTHLKVVK